MLTTTRAVLLAARLNASADALDTLARRLTHDKGDAVAQAIALRVATTLRNEAEQLRRVPSTINA